jgi:hypothetical protein
MRHSADDDDDDVVLQLRSAACADHILQQQRVFAVSPANRPKTKKPDKVSGVLLLPCRRHVISGLQLCRIAATLSVSVSRSGPDWQVQLQRVSRA